MGKSVLRACPTPAILRPKEITTKGNKTVPAQGAQSVWRGDPSYKGIPEEAAMWTALGHMALMSLAEQE